MNSHLQICDADRALTHANVFALGDVAETGGPKMARAAMMQAEVVVQNILGVIKTGGKATETYSPQTEVEGAIKLTLGIVSATFFLSPGWLAKNGNASKADTKACVEADCDVDAGVERTRADVD